MPLTQYLEANPSAIMRIAEKNLAIYKKIA
jgi:hypothetical protein